MSPLTTVGQILSRHTITTHLQIDHIADPYIDDAKEPLILLLELLLVENLNRKNTIFVDFPVS